MPAGVLPRLSLSPARLQLGIFLFAYLLYSAARFVTIGDLSVAQANADWIMDLEDTLSLGIESSVQQALTGTVFLWVLNHLYLAAQLVVLPGALVFLYRRCARCTSACGTRSSPPGCYRSRSTPPSRSRRRGSPTPASSTRSPRQTGLSLDSSLTTSFYNELAAVPSLHVGFAVVIGIIVAAAVRHPVLKVVWWLWGPAIGLAVVATGNHYVFDIAAGVVAAALGYLLGAAVARAKPRERPTTHQPCFAEA